MFLSAQLFHPDQFVGSSKNSSVCSYRKLVIVGACNFSMEYLSLIATDNDGEGSGRHLLERIYKGVSIM